VLILPLIGEKVIRRNLRRRLGESNEIQALNVAFQEPVVVLAMRKFFC
jgi:hypothetical protein